MIEVELLPARYGDSIWIRYGKSKSSLHHVLIDTGFKETATAIRQRFHDDAKLVLDLFVMTHIDADHIEGSVTLLQDPVVATKKRIKQAWFNGWGHIDEVPDDALGALQGEYLSALLRDSGIPWNRDFASKAAMVLETKKKLPVFELDGGMKLTLLSPSPAKLRKLRDYWRKDLKGRLKPGDEKKAMKLLDDDSKYALDALGTIPNVAKLSAMKFKEDAAPANGSSIAFLAEYEKKKMLFTGDAHPSVLLSSVERLVPAGKTLKVDLWKVAHHGSRANTSPALLERVRCKNAVFSTNGDKFKHPDLECVARYIDQHEGTDLALHFNYESPKTKPWSDKTLMKTHGYRTFYGDEGSLVVSL
jgi:hypothetical protein